MPAKAEDRRPVVTEADGTLSWTICEGVLSTADLFFKLPQKTTELKFKFWSIKVLENDPDIVIAGELIFI